MMPRKSIRAAMGIGALLLGVNCNENLPVGPNTFAATLIIVPTHDTLIVGDQSEVDAQAKDGGGNVIQALSFTWTSSDTTVAALRPPASGDTTGRAKNILGKHAGQTVLTLALPDPRFASSPVTHTKTVVVGGIKILSTHDTTLTAVNDTGTAIAAGLIHVNGALVTSPSQGIRWTHLGLHAAVVGTSGDTIKYIARSNGADTLIATANFCLLGAKCADSAIVRVSQQLSLTLSSHAFLAWSFNDSVGPSVTLADRRGNGLAGTSVRLVPNTVADSAIVLVTQPIGSSTPATGQLAAPQLIARANGTAKVTVLGVAIDGLTVVATDSLTATVRQVARHVAVEPLRAVLTANDSIPIRSIARDARGSTIADATISIAPSGIPITGIWAGPTTTFGPASNATITPTLTGDALPSNHPLAPQTPPSIDISQITLIQRDTAIAGTTSRSITLTALDSLARPAFGQWVRFGTFGTFGLDVTPDSVQLDQTGSATFVWTPLDTAVLHTLTGLRGTPTGPTTLADSAGRIVLRRSLLVIPDVPSPLKSTVDVTPTTVPNGTTATITIHVKDRFSNPVLTAKPSDIVITSDAVGGMLSVPVCSLGVCTATYTAPPAAGPDAIHVKVQATEILGSPVVITIT